MELQSKGSVLLVEDHQDIAELVYDYMEDVGYELDYAPDGEVGSTWLLKMNTMPSFSTLCFPGVMACRCVGSYGRKWGKPPRC